MLSKVFVHSQTKPWLECLYSLVQEEILKSLHRLKLSDSDLSPEKSYPAFEQLGPGKLFTVEPKFNEVPRD